MSFAVTLTRYFPFDDYKSAAEARREGGPRDRKGRRLHTLEEHQADPAAHPYVAISGDPARFAYGQRLIIPALGKPGAAWIARARAAGLREPLTYYVARVVDDGAHFIGDSKVERYPGHEPLDVAMTYHTAPGVVTAEATKIEGDTDLRPVAVTTNGGNLGAALAAGAVVLLGAILIDP